MARTRGTSGIEHRDDGVLLGKGGVPIPTSPVTTQMLPAGPPQYPDDATVPLDRGGNFVSPVAPTVRGLTPMRMDGRTVVHGPGAEPPPAPRVAIAYRSNRGSWPRNMEAFELAMLLDLGSRGFSTGEGFTVEVPPEEHAKLDGNLKRLFVPVFSD